MTFVKGQSGNPAGRRPGSRNKATAIMDEMLLARSEELVRRAMDNACLGNAAAIRACFDRMYPRRRGAPVAFALPPVETAADVPVANRAICAAVAEGELTPAEGETLSRMVETMGRSLMAAEAAAEVLQVRAVVGVLGERAGLDLAAIAASARRHVAREAVGRGGPHRHPGPCPNCGFEPAGPPAHPTHPYAGDQAANDARVDGSDRPQSAQPSPDWKAEHRDPDDTAAGPLARAADLQARDRTADGASAEDRDRPPAGRNAPDLGTAPREPGREPPGPLASATNLQAPPPARAPDPPARQAAEGDGWMRDFLGPEADAPWPPPSAADKVFNWPGGSG